MAIVKVAYELFREQGYDETTVEEIAAASEIAPRTFYRYFDSKDAILAECGFQVIDRAMDEVGPDPSIGELVRSVAAELQRLIDDGRLESTIRLLREHPRFGDDAALWRDRWAMHLASRLAAEQGLAQPTLEQKVRGSVTINILGTAGREWLLSPQDSTISELASEALAHAEYDQPGWGDGEVTSG